jgi:hypothetical protein
MSPAPHDQSLPASSNRQASSQVGMCERLRFFASGKFDEVNMCTCIDWFKCEIIFS